MIPRVYVDTSVIGGCLDDEFSLWSRRIFEEFNSGTKISVVSDLTLQELEEAPDEVQQILLKSVVLWRFYMKNKIDAVKLQREIRLKLGGKYLISQENELKELNEKFGHLKNRVATANLR